MADRDQKTDRGKCGEMSEPLFTIDKLVNGRN